MPIILFLICFAASTLGAIAGFGGGVIIKPVLDALAILPVSTISFLSSCTVFSMSIASLIRTRNNGVQLALRTSTPLAIGAVGGGLLGKWLFELVRSGFGSESTLGLIQAICLTILNIAVFIYVCKKSSLRSYHVQNMFAALLIGLFLGMSSSFIGIGGGPINVAALFLFFSMDAKTAAKNSIYIILFSQAASLITSVCSGTIPSFNPASLVLMAAGGIAGALAGAACSKRMNSLQVEKLLRVLMIVVTCIGIYNIIQFVLAM